MPELGFTDFLLESLALLESEVPEFYGGMCRCLSRMRVKIAVGKEVVCLEFERDRVQRRPPSPEPAVEVQTSREAILALIGAELTLHRRRH